MLTPTPSNSKGLTCGQLIAQLLQYPHEMPVVLQTGDDTGWYIYVDGVVGPTHTVSEGWVSEHSGYSLPTLLRGVPFDARDV